MNDIQYTKYLFDSIKKISFVNPGVIRDTYGKGENLTHDFLIKEVNKFTKDIIIDYGGNFLATYPGKLKKKIVIGSHLDSQKHGGNFDGLTGVIMGLILIKFFFENNIRPKYSISVMGIRGEESCWFPYSYIGSKIAIGKFDKKLLDSLKRSDTKKSLAYHINKSGFNAKKVSKKQIKFDIKNFKFFIEPHIEQGPVLEKKKIPLGIVTGIRGSFRFRDAFCKGEYLHSGATPYEYRKDSVVAVSNLVNEMNTFWKEQLKKRKDLVITFGQFFTDNEEHSFAKSSGLVNFCIDVRSNSKNTLEYTKKTLIKKIKLIEKKTNTKFFLGKETNSEPALMDKKLIKKFQIYSKKISMKFETMASGAGHDASIFANNGIPSLMLFIRNKNGSHNPKEYMSIKNFEEVFKVLKGIIKDNYI
ncbi:hydantoinase/carbamoylase family amidase [Pelagibacteraceae bacterium]|nr:hydantoinase/carbamoylase family amidase [Pelagibacteraceae bacterium]MDC3156818.1 hydantoinase/carbamoylase family amidase [Pelagibacteraceae bacterium]